MRNFSVPGVGRVAACPSALCLVLLRPKRSSYCAGATFRAPSASRDLDDFVRANLCAAISRRHAGSSGAMVPALFSAPRLPLT
eukprot:2774079-Pyramimonas_sp.AAC.1